MTVSFPPEKPERVNGVDGREKPGVFIGGDR